MSARLPLLAAAAAALALLPAPRVAAQSGGDALLYIGTYDQAVYELDEATGERLRRIPLQSGVPRLMDVSADEARFHIVDITFENVEIVDIASGTTVDRFTLSRGTNTVRIYSQAIHPSGDWAVFLTKSYRKLRDRFEVSEPTLLKVDLRSHEVTDTVPWPVAPQDRDRLMFSPDGELLYFFADELVAVETDGFTEVDRWPYAEALGEGAGDFRFGFPRQAYAEPGIFTGLFRVRDPVQSRSIMGIATVDLATRDVDFATLGPAAPVGFALAPDGRRGYGLQQDVGNWHFWTFDVEAGRVMGREAFAGRPRMSLLVSSNGELLYVYNAGNTIDVYDADTYALLRTVDLGADTTTPLFVLPRR